MGETPYLKNFCFFYIRLLKHHDFRKAGVISFNSRYFTITFLPFLIYNPLEDAETMRP